MRRAVCLVLLMLIGGVSVRAESLHGRLVIGKQTYAITGDVRRTGYSIELGLSLSGFGVSRRVELLLGEVLRCRLDGVPQELSPALVSSWREQLASGLTSLIRNGGFKQVKPKADFVDYESETLFDLRKGLPGRLRLSYHRDDTTAAVLRSGGLRLVAVRFFSLAEWNNTFGEYVSLSLDFE